ncbi:MAG TPA: Lpp/OprI family alanine-zipper lipoprotein [Geomonas sp.]|nr:Lpp/OprI family alanine-zipper lipoprotein [Geomonas sp.]
MKRAILGIFVTLVAGTVIGCATSGDLAKVQQQQNQTAAKADQALQEAQSAKATAEAAKRQADAANAAATRAETTANAATNSATGRAAGGQIQETPAQSPDVFQKSMEK